MPNIAPAYITVNPNYTFPELLLPYTQVSGSFNLLATGGPLVRLSEGDQIAYINRIDVRTTAASGQSAYNSLPSCGIALSQISTPTYLVRNRAEYDHHDTAAMGRRGVSIVEAQRLAMRQGIFQQGRIANLYGFNPANGEGLTNTNGATAVTLPADSFGNTTVRTYDNGQMAFFLAQQIQALKTATYQLGIGQKFCFCGPQRILGIFEYNVVQLVQFQRPGAGTTSTAGVIKDILEMNGDEILWTYDDTLINKGTGGNTDLIVLTMPEVIKPEGDAWDTNEFARLAPGLSATTLQLCDMVAPREIPTPMPGGAIDVLAEIRMSSGWGVRPEAVFNISMSY